MAYPTGASGYGSAGGEPPAAGGGKAAPGGARGPIWVGSAVVAGLGLVNFLFGFLPYVKIEGITQLGGSDTTRTFFQFQTVTPLAFLLLGGVLAGISLLPKQNWRAPAAAASIVGWLVLLFQSFSLDDGLGLGVGGYAVLVLGFVQAVLAVLLLAVEVGLLETPAGRRARPESAAPLGGQYPSSYGSTPGYERPSYGSGYGQQYGQAQPEQGQYGQSQPGPAPYGQAQTGQGRAAGQYGQGQYGQAQPGQGQYGRQPYGRPQPEYGSAPYSRPPAPPPGYPPYGGQPPGQPYPGPQGPGQPAPGQSAGAADANANDATQVFRQPSEEPARLRSEQPSPSTPSSSTPRSPESDATQAHPAPDPESTQAMPAPGPSTGAQPRATAPSPADDDPTQAYRPSRDEK